jgi:hypothetical protein
MRSAIPSASRSITARVASGVTSRGESPGATRSQDEIRVACVAPRSEPRDDRDSVVGYYVVTSDRVSALRAPLSDDTTRQVVTIRQKRRNRRQ